MLAISSAAPAKARYLQLFHNLGDAAMCINGRKYLDNTPPLIAGLNTRMRFGLVGMRSVDGFHNFSQQTSVRRSPLLRRSQWTWRRRNVRQHHGDVRATTTA
jgi:hypothetical protein